VLTLGAPVRIAEEQPEDDQEDRDLPRLAEVILDEALAETAGDDGRNGGDDNRPRQSLVGTLNRPYSKRPPQAPQKELGRLLPACGGGRCAR